MLTRLPDLVTLYSQSDHRAFSAPQGVWQDARFSLTLTQQETLLADVQADETPLCYLRLRWHFSDAEKRREPIRIYGDAWERAGGNLEWRGIVPERCMPWFMLVANGTDAQQQRAGRLTEGFGVKTQPGAMCFWQYDAAGATLWMDIRSGGEGVILGGRTLRTAEIVMRAYADCTAFEAGQQFCRALSRGALAAPYPVYGANNWYYAYGVSSHEQILEDTRIVARLCAGNSNPPFMVIDDGWSPNPKNGPWDRGNAAFPDMAALAAAIRAQGVRPGIWVRYIGDENQVCGVPKAWHLSYTDHYLDPSHPEVLAYIRQTTKRLVDWGYQLIKFDCSTQDILGRRGYKIPYVIAEDGWHFYDQGKTSAEIITNFYRAIREAAGEDVILIGCATISHLSAGLVQLGRTGADINGMNWDITRRMGVNTLAFRMMQHGTFYDVDADCVGITGAIRWEQVGKWLDILSKSGTPLFVSCKPGVLNPAQTEELRQAYARNAVQRDTLIPLDWMENICPERWLLNGEEIRYDWYADDVNVMFEGKSL